MKILIGGPARQDERTFVEHLKSINGLLVPEDAEVHRYYIINDCPELKQYLELGEYEEINTGDVYVTSEQTHTWSVENLTKMCDLRNRMIQKVLDEGYDYWFMVDTDVIVSKYTLMQLMTARVDIVANIFWTEGEPGSGRYWSNCWQYDQCTYGPADARQWLEPGVYEVGGTGACMLTHRRVFEAGVDYSPIHNIKCFHGEDRWFCIRAVCNGFKIWIDTHHPVMHLYRPSILEQYLRLRYGGET